MTGKHPDLAGALLLALSGTLCREPFIKHFRICVETYFPGKSSKEQVPHGSLTELQEATGVIWIVLLIGKLGPAVRALPTAAGKVGELIGGSAFC